MRLASRALLTWFTLLPLIACSSSEEPGTDGPSSSSSGGGASSGGGTDPGPDPDADSGPGTGSSGSSSGGETDAGPDAASPGGNGIKDGTETDIDCGGGAPGVSPCANDKVCAKAADCTSAFCNAQLVCKTPTGTDEAKNGDESDIDCGGTTTGAPRCETDRTCNGAPDCVSLVCAEAGVCNVATGTDEVKNGDESDVDCGGTTTGAPRCAVDKLCLSGADCLSRGCGYEGTCVSAPSCAVHFGGDTCGAGEIGSGAEQHESCCTSLEVAGFSDPDHAGKTVTLDKYEVTAGRVREFVTQLTATLGGQPNVQAWIQANRPDVWNDAWTDTLPTTADELKFAFGAMGDGSADYSSGFYVHGQNCAIADGRPGYPTYWQPADVLASMQNTPRDFDQPTLDVKAMSCISHAMLAAFCAWDGGQMATAGVIGQVSGGIGQPSAPINYSLDAGFSGGSEMTYAWPYTGNTENGGRIAAPGRIPQDSVAGPAGNWMDLIGNLNEMAMPAGGNGSFQLLNYGLGYSSARADVGGEINNPARIPFPAYKAGYSGGRCMRFR